MAVTDLASCLPQEQFGPSISFASSTLFLFDYCLTFFDELRFVWFQRRRSGSTSTILFCIARYAGMVSAIVTLSQTPTTSLLLANMSTALRVIVIVASEAILGVRTWAIWGKNRSILIFLCIVSAAALGGNAALVIRGVNNTHIQSPDANCTIVVNSKSQAYLIPYVVTIAYETITMSLSAVRILKWRGQMTPSARTPLLNTLWKDGIMYFTWMIALGIANIFLVFHGSVAVRTGGAQLQSSLHSILSTRIVLHLARLPSSQRSDRGSVPVSSLFTPTTMVLMNETSFMEIEELDYR